MFKDLDNRTQLALALMATEKVYLNWVENHRHIPSGKIYDGTKCSLHLFKRDLQFIIWRKGSECAYVSVFMQCTPQGYCYISVENYFRGVARDTLDLNNPSATFDDYLKLANNFPEPSVDLLIQGLSECFKESGLFSEYSYYLGVAATLLDLKD